MPRSAQKRQSRRTEVSQRDTYRHTPGIEPIANPVSSYTNQGGGGNLKALQDALKTGGNLVESYAEMETTTNRIEQREGRKAAKAGQEPDEEASKPYMAGYLKVQGQSDAAQFETDVNELYRNHWNDDPETFQKRLEELENEYIQGQSQAYLEGFVPNAEQVEQKALGKYQQTQHEQMSRNFLDNASKAVDQQVEWIQDQKYSSKKKSRNIRQVLSYYQKQAKDMGIPRDRVTKRVLAKIGGKAEKKGDPDLMDFIYEPGQGSGIRVVDTKLGTKARQWEKAAVETARQMEENKQAQMEETRKKLKTQIHRDVVSFLHEVDPSNDEALRDMKQQIRTKFSNPQNNPYGVALDPEDMDSLLTSIDDMLEPAAFAENTDTEVYSSLRKNVVDINTPEDSDAFLSQLQSVQGALTRDDYRSLMEKALRERNSMTNTDKQKQKNRFNDWVAGKMKTLKEAGTSLISINDGERQQADANRMLFFESEMKLWLDTYRMEHDEYPGIPEIRDAAKTIKEDAYERYPDPKMVDTGSGGNEGENKQQGSSEDEQDQKQKVTERLENLTR